MWPSISDDYEVVERAFRSLKTVDLKVRPIRLWRTGRPGAGAYPAVHAGLLRCKPCNGVEWHPPLAGHALAPVLFDDDDQETAQAQSAVGGW